MFGFSIQKLLFTVAAIFAVWYGFKWVGRMKEVRDREARDRLRRQAGNAGSSGGGVSGAAEEMVECPACGAFVAATGAKSCGKAECPYPG
ncbi:MAG: hypothetical protein CMM60_06500 [Rhodospirillaceae bacterium]|jgi:uncharacterized protein|nr:hypothetical protein [Rhodospirillaceae bacterium]|tara:strand:- start:5303 stop:5572 length:270 start_codon:yes stop_codon:yes gene_type:complete